MNAYSDLIERVLIGDEVLVTLRPREPRNRELLRRILAADDAMLAGGKTAENPATFALVRGGVLYALDALEESHAVFQAAHGDLGAYWHGMVHRREGDFDNARYWFRQAGVLPCFSRMHRDAAPYSPDMAKQLNWDPYLYTGQCEQERFGAEGLDRELRELQRVEFLTLLDYCLQESHLR